MHNRYVMLDKGLTFYTQGHFCDHVEVFNVSSILSTVQSNSQKLSLLMLMLVYTLSP